MRIPCSSYLSGLVALAFTVTILGCGGRVVVDGATSPDGPPDVPPVAESPRRVVQIAANGDVTCALRAEGSVACWGQSFGPEIKEIAVSGAVAVGVGAVSACALLAEGTVECWSQPWTGEVGAPTLLPGLTDAVQLSMDAGHACALRAGGSAVCWGSNFAGMLGDGTMIDRIDPVPIVGLDAAVEIAAGEFSTCARLGDGSVRCWGRDLAGQLGDGDVVHAQCDETTTCSATPVVVAGLFGAVELSLGLNGAAARRADGHVVGWGWNGAGELGDGTIDDRATPVEALGLTDATRIYSGYLRRCAIRAGGSVACWGAPTGIGVDVAAALAPTPIAGLEHVVSITGGWSHLCALDDVGRVWCWGDNQAYELGDGTTTPREAPGLVLGL